MGPTMRKVVEPLRDKLVDVVQRTEPLREQLAELPIVQLLRGKSEQLFDWSAFFSARRQKWWRQCQEWKFPRNLQKIMHTMGVTRDR